VDLAAFKETIMKGCDTNRDGKISKKVSTNGGGKGRNKGKNNVGR
jgi:hypothetical protein